MLLMVIYADVLIILNTYINFILLRLSGYFVGAEINRLRLFSGALAGGVYSLIILADGMSRGVSVILKIAVSALIVI